MQPTIKFTIEKEQNEKINYLDITIHRKNGRSEFSLYRKPTQPNIIIPNSSCDHHDHKLFGIHFLLNWVCTYPITTEAKQTEIHIIKNILQRNEYNANLIEKALSQSRKHNTHEEPKQKAKWATFTYCGKEVRQITKIFKDTQLNTVFRTQNTIENILRHKTKTEKYDSSGVYQMKCLDCPLRYIGQTGRTFKIRYKEHMCIQAIRNNNGNSGYSNHILNTGHTYETITDTMDVIRNGRKGRHLNTLEKYYIYRISKTNVHLNDIYNETQNPIFQEIYEIYNR
jgi:hypothetical protein